MTSRLLLCSCSGNVMEDLEEVDWLEESSEIRQRGARLLASMEWADCSFLLGPHRVPARAHKLILAMASPVFKAMFYGPHAEGSATIPVPDIQPDVFKKLLQYIYTDNIEVDSDTIAIELYFAAQKYELKHLLKECISFIGSNVTPQNACHIFEFANLIENEMLENKSLKVIKTDTKLVLLDRSFEDLHLGTVINIFSLDEMTIDSELDLLAAAERYFMAKKKAFEESSAPSTSSQQEVEQQKVSHDVDVPNPQCQAFEESSAPSKSSQQEVEQQKVSHDVDVPNPQCQAFEESSAPSKSSQQEVEQQKVSHDVDVPNPQCQAFEESSAPSTSSQQEVEQQKVSHDVDVPNPQCQAFEESSAPSTSSQQEVEQQKVSHDVDVPNPQCQAFEDSSAPSTSLQQEVEQQKVSHDVDVPNPQCQAFEESSAPSTSSQQEVEQQKVSHDVDVPNPQCQAFEESSAPSTFSQQEVEQQKVSHDVDVPNPQCQAFEESSAPSTSSQQEVEQQKVSHDVDVPNPQCQAFEESSAPSTSSQQEVEQQKVSHDVDVPNPQCNKSNSVQNGKVTQTVVNKATSILNAPLACFNTDERARSEATFCFTVQNFKDLMGRAFSPPCYIHGLPWRILIRVYCNAQKEKKLDAYVLCNNDTDSYIFSCKASVRLKMISHQPSKKHFCVLAEDCLYSKDMHCYTPDIMKWSDILNPNEGFIKDGAITFEAHVAAEEPEGLSRDSKKQTTDFGIGDLAVRGVLEQIRFLTLTGKMLTEYVPKMALLTDEDMLAILMNISSKETRKPMPDGFSRCRKRRISLKRKQKKLQTVAKRVRFE